MTDEFNTVNFPKHYCSGNVECIDAMESAFGTDAVRDFCLCNAFKYLWRNRQKGGTEDLKKARWYLERLIYIEDTMMRSVEGKLNDKN